MYPGGGKVGLRVLPYTLRVAHSAAPQPQIPNLPQSTPRPSHMLPGTDGMSKWGRVSAAVSGAHCCTHSRTCAAVPASAPTATAAPLLILNVCPSTQYADMESPHRVGQLQAPGHGMGAATGGSMHGESARPRPVCGRLCLVALQHACVAPVAPSRGSPHSCRAGDKRAVTHPPWLLPGEATSLWPPAAGRMRGKAAAGAGSVRPATLPAALS